MFSAAFNTVCVRILIPMISRSTFFSRKPHCSANRRSYGPVAQLGAHHIRIVGVVGSNPIWSTKKRHDRRSCLFLDSAPLRGAPPFGDCTCSAEVNSACAKVLRCKTLETPDFRRVWTSVCGANLPCTFFTFPKRTVDEIDKCTGFWYNEHKKWRICCCTLPIQVSPASPQEPAQNAKKKSETPWEFRFCAM